MTVSLTMLNAQDESGRRLFRLDRDYLYEIGPGSTITVPSGYVTNFGTIPRWFAWIISPAQMGEAAIVHDWMCNEYHAGQERMVSGYSRWMADAVLYEVMSRMEFNLVTRTLVYYGVRIGSWVCKQNWQPAPSKIEVKK